MSKITFRADDDLISKLEELDASKSEIMREALRLYLDRGTTLDSSETRTFNSVGERVDDPVTERINGIITQLESKNININITLDDECRTDLDTNGSSGSRETHITDSNNADKEDRQCSKCGESLSESHVYCPNCGEKANHRVICECGDEIQSDWSFCPSCGRRTPAADVLDQS